MICTHHYPCHDLEHASEEQKAIDLAILKAVLATPIPDVSKDTK